MQNNMKVSKDMRLWIIKQNILKNLTVVFLTVVLALWVKPYTQGLEKDIVNIFVFLSIFPLGAMFGYFAFSYSETNLKSSNHRILADLATFIFLTIICFAISFSTLLGVMAVPKLMFPFSILAVLLISGCLIYDFWNLYSNLEKEE